MYTIFYGQIGSQQLQVNLLSDWSGLHTSLQTTGVVHKLMEQLTKKIMSKIMLTAVTVAYD